MGSKSKKDDMPLSVTTLNDDVIIVVDGDATMKISYVLKKFIIDLVDESEKTDRNFKIDLKNCRYMDSTFTGILIILEKYTKQKLNKNFEILNPSPFCEDVINTMGLNNLFKITNDNTIKYGKPIKLKTFQMETLEEAILMYLAHKELSEINEDNEKEFEYVQKYLKEHIETSTGKDIEDLDLESDKFN